MVNSSIQEMLARMDGLLEPVVDRLIRLRRDLHAHPELSDNEYRTTQKIIDELESLGLKASRLPEGAGLTCDVGRGSPAVALRADIDALAVPDSKSVAYRSVEEGVSHSCGHDVHTAVVFGSGAILHELDRKGLVPGAVRLIFQPAEETVLGARRVIDSGRMKGIERIFALHCDPHFEVGSLAVREGPITSAYDRVAVRVLSQSGASDNIVTALAKIVTDLPLLLNRAIDTRATPSLVWGRIDGPSSVPDGQLSGIAEGTVRFTRDEARARIPQLVEDQVNSIARIYGVRAETLYTQGIPPTVNDHAGFRILREAARMVVGANGVHTAPQSLGGDDFGQYLLESSGAYARLGVRTPGRALYELHQGDFDVDEGCIAIGAKTLAMAAVAALS